MTFMVGMETSPGKVIFVGDEQQTIGGIRTADTAQKLKEYGNHVYGSAGSVAFSNDVYEMLKKDDSAKSLREKAEYISEVIRDIKYTKKSNLFKDRYGMDMGEAVNGDSMVRTGVQNVEPILKEIDRDVADTFRSDYFIGGLHEDYESPLYLITFGGNVLPREKYAALGSGIDKAEIVINDYLKSIKPEERDKMKLYEGCRLLFQAMKSAWGNVGVGGRTQIIISESGIEDLRKIGSDESELLHNTLFAENLNYLSKNFTEGIFREVVENGAKAQDMIKRLGRKLTKSELMRLYFTEGRHR